MSPVSKDRLGQNRPDPIDRLQQLIQRCTLYLTFPISEFGLCSCGFLIHPL